MPTEQQYTGNYTGKALAGIGLTQQLDTSHAGNGIYTETILGAADKYMIDIFGSIQTHRPEETPMLSIMDSLGTETANGPYYIWTDEYRGTSWWDISLDTLRQKNAVSSHNATALPDSGYGASIGINVLPVAATANTYTGGVLLLQPVTVVGATTAGILGCTAPNSDPTANPAVYSPITAMTVLSNDYMAGQAFVPTNAAANHVMFAIKDATTNIGSTDVVWNKIRVLLANMGYTEFVYISNESTTCSGSLLRYSSAARLPVYMAFPNVTAFDGGVNADADTVVGTFSAYTQVIARLEAVWYGKISHTGTVDYLIFAVNFGDSNETFSLAAYVGTNESEVFDSVMIGQPHKVGDPSLTTGTGVFGLTASAASPYAGSISRMLLIGEAQEAPLPVPEGDKFNQTGNYTMGREQMINNCQIFVSPAYGITGTTQASKFRFGDNFQESREKNLSIYKKRMQAAFQLGIKYETIATHSTNGFVAGQPVRATSGMMDYAMFPIRHIKKPLVASGWNVSNVATFINWMETLGDNLAAFRQAEKKTLTFTVSQKFINRLNTHVRTMLGNTTGGVNPYMGGMITLNAPSAISFGLEYYEYKTSSGVVMRFIHDPGLDNTPSFRVPHWIYGQSSISPRDLLFSIDPKNMKRFVLRPDKIYGNIQDIGQDAFLEAMRGESGFMLRFPQNHAIVWAPEA